MRARRRPDLTALAAKVAMAVGNAVGSLPCWTRRTNQRQLRAIISAMASSRLSSHLRKRKTTRPCVLIRGTRFRNARCRLLVDAGLDESMGANKGATSNEINVRAA